jgi:hypothetical protein
MDEVKLSSVGLAQAQPIRIVFLGRLATLGALTCHFASVGPEQGLHFSTTMRFFTGVAGAEVMEMSAFSNQKAALQFIHKVPPQVVLADVDGRPESRVRFAEMVRYRLPPVMIFAMGRRPLQGSLPYDGTVELPTTLEQAHALLKRFSNQPVSHVLQQGPLQLNLATRMVTSPRGQHRMTPKQCALLQLLMSNLDQVVSRSDIMQLIWETSYMADTRTLDVHIRWLRECIEPDPSNPVYLLTVRGKGYQLCLPAA